MELKENKHIYWILFGLSFAAFLGAFDVNAFNLALVWIEKDLHLSLAMTEWIMNGFLLTFSSLLLISGRLSDILGHKKLLLIGIAIFAVSSFLGGISVTGWQVITCRVLQGIGTALFWPGTQSVIYSIFPEKKVTSALGILLAISGLALALGPVLSGLILYFIDWRWIFFINLPFSLLSFLIILFCYHETDLEKTDKSLDIGGLIYIFIFSFSLVYGLTLLGARNVNLYQVFLWLFFAVLFLAIYIYHESCICSPLIPLTHFRNHDFMKSVWIRSTLMFSFIAILFTVSYYLQHFQQQPPWKAGLYFLPLTLFFGISSFFGSKLTTRLPIIPMIYFGAILSTFGCLVLGCISPDAMSFWMLFLPFMLFGIGFGTFAPLNNYYTMQTLPKTFTGFAISFAYMVGLMFSSLAISLSAAFMQHFGWMNMTKALETNGYFLTDPDMKFLRDVLAGVRSLGEIPGRFPGISESLEKMIKDSFFFAFQIDMFLCAAFIAVSFLLIRLSPTKRHLID